MNRGLTIGIPVCERHEFFKAALLSAVAQKEADAILVSDNCSSHTKFKDIIDEISDSRIEYFRHSKRLCVSDNWNFFIFNAKTKWLSLLHDDDTLTDEAMRKLLHASQSFSSAGLIFGMENVIDERGRVVTDFKHLADNRVAQIETERICMQNQFCAAGAIFDRALAANLGGFDRRRQMTPDWDLWFRIALTTSIIKCNAITGNYRVYRSAKRCTSTQEANGRMLPRIAAQQKRNIHRLRCSMGSSIKPDRKQFSLIAQDILRLRFCDLSKKARQTYSRYAILFSSQKRSHQFLHRLSPSILLFYFIALGVTRPARNFFQSKFSPRKP